LVALAAGPAADYLRTHNIMSTGKGAFFSFYRHCFCYCFSCCRCLLLFVVVVVVVVVDVKVDVLVLDVVN